MLVDCVIEDDRWAAHDLDDLAERAALATLAHLAIASAGFEIALLACDDTRIAALNADFRDKPAPTNVLSWPAEERAPETPGGTPDYPDMPDADGPPEDLGDIAIAYDTCAREADQGRIAFSDHVTHLVVHAVLHLLGHDHETDPDAALMEGLEVEILGNLGISNPYSAQLRPEAAHIGQD